MAERRGDWHWPVGLATALLAMIAGSQTFLWIAVRHPDAEVVEDAYVAGLAFDQEMALRRRASELGLDIGIEAVPEEGNEWIATVRVLDRDGRVLVPSSGVLRRIRPTQGGFDTDFELEERGDRMEASLALPLHGRWELEATLQVGGEPVQARATLWRP